jgi:hypothetical protein
MYVHTCTPVVSFLFPVELLLRFTDSDSSVKLIYYNCLTVFPTQILKCSVLYYVTVPDDITVVH